MQEKAGQSVAVLHLVRADQRPDLVLREPAHRIDLDRVEGAGRPAHLTAYHVEDLVGDAVHRVERIQQHGPHRLAAGLFQQLAPRGFDGRLAILDAAGRELPLRPPGGVAVDLDHHVLPGLVLGDDHHCRVVEIQQVVFFDDVAVGELHFVDVQVHPRRLVDEGPFERFGFWGRGHGWAVIIIGLANKRLMPRFTLTRYVVPEIFPAIRLKLAERLR